MFNPINANVEPSSQQSQHALAPPYQSAVQTQWRIYEEQVDGQTRCVLRKATAGSTRAVNFIARFRVDEAYVPWEDLAQFPLPGYNIGYVISFDKTRYLERTMVLLDAFQRGPVLLTKQALKENFAIVDIPEELELELPNRTGSSAGTIYSGYHRRGFPDDSEMMEQGRTCGSSGYTR